MLDARTGLGQGPRQAQDRSLESSIQSGQAQDRGSAPPLTCTGLGPWGVGGWGWGWHSGARLGSKAREGMAPCGLLEGPGVPLPPTRPRPLMPAPSWGARGSRGHEAHSEAPLC
jgi:hypothetical protein